MYNYVPHLHPFAGQQFQSIAMGPISMNHQNENENYTAEASQ
jgi:hypothetical protein